MNSEHMQESEKTHPLRVLIVTNMYPSPDLARSGIFIQRQVESIRALGVDIEVLVEDRTRKGMGVYFGTARRVKRALRAKQFDILHCRYGGFMAAAAWIGHGRTPFVLSLCGSDLLGEPQLGGFRAVTAWAGSVASRWVAKRARHVFVMSFAMRDMLQGSAPCTFVSVIPSGVDMSTFLPIDRATCRTRLGWDIEGRHILFGGYHDAPRKRLQLARDAASLAGASGTHIELHVPDNVPGGEMPVWINAADLVLLTSTHEGSPNIVKEALACDVSVVSTDVGDVSERLHGISGCYVTKDTAEELAKAILQVIQRRGDGRIAGRIAVAPISLSATAGRILKIYEGIANDR